MADIGALSSLGLGSQGALSYDIIDKLKKADENTIIKPIENRILQEKKRSVELTNLTTLLATLKGTASTLSYDDIYSKVSTDISGTSAQATVHDGVSSQTITLDIANIATNDIKESKAFSSQDSTFTNSNDTLKFELAGGDSFTLDVNSDTTITELAQQINDNSNGKITASILNVGGDDPYKLIIKSTETGADNAITISSTGGGSAADDLDMSTVGDGAQDANFTYNGVSVTRASNNITDLINGVNIKLVDSGKTTIKISQDIDSLKDSVNSFIDAYNSLVDSLNETTSYNSDTKKAGIFQNTSQIRGIRNEIDKIIFNFDKNGYSLDDFGITLNGTGHLELDETKFNSKVKSVPSGLINFFKGETETHPESGLFTKLNDSLKSIFLDSNSQLKLYQDYLDNEIKNLNNNKTKQAEKLDEKYNILAKKFAAYDRIIAKFDAQSKSLQMQIQSFINSK